MFSTKYPNTIRTVSGSTPVFNTDSILAIDTSTIAGVINLGIIAQGFWNTTWKLYIYDSSNNASVNNITINAGAGQTINGSSSVTISTNGGGYLIRVLSNTQFIGTASGGSSAISLTTTGTNGASTLIGNTLNIPIYGSVIQLTKAAMVVLINANTVVKGQLYQITDAGFTDLGVIVTGTSTSSISANGTGLFYNADYQGVGDYSSTTPTYSGTNRGIWYSTYVGAIAVGDVVVWNNLNYINLTGVWGTAPNTDTTNWLLLSKSSTTGYIKASDFVNYNIGGNYIVFRADNLGNQVSLGGKVGSFLTLLDWPWGNSKCTRNIVLGDSELTGITNSGLTITFNFIESSKITDSTLDLSSGSFTDNYIQSSVITFGKNNGEFSSNMINSSSVSIDSIFVNSGANSNIINSGSTIIITDLGAVSTFSRFGNNVISNDSTITVTKLDGIIELCTLSRGGTLNIGTLSTSIVIGKCEVSDINTVTLPLVPSSLIGYCIRKGFSNWEETLDATTAVTGSTLTIPTASSFVGVFKISNISGTTLDTFVNVTSNHNITVQPDAGSTSTFIIAPVSISLAIADNVIEAASASGATTYVGRVNGCDEAILGKVGNLVGLIIKNIWI
tara:strand:- start:1521 stop:3368 length:1848 start_codon:yes stop_codon:yes gene_type:complete